MTARAEDIGPVRRIIEVEPWDDPVDLPTPAPAVPAPQREPVPA